MTLQDFTDVLTSTETIAVYDLKGVQLTTDRNNIAYADKEIFKIQPTIGNTNVILDFIYTKEIEKSYRGYLYKDQLKGYGTQTSAKTLLLITDAKRTDATARKVIDVIGDICKTKPETLERAKANKPTLKDIKNRMDSVLICEEKGRIRIIRNGQIIIDAPANDFIVRRV